MKPIGCIKTLNGYENKQGYYVYNTDEYAVTLMTKATGMSGAGGALYLVKAKEMSELHYLGVMPDVYEQGNRVYDSSCSATLRANGGSLGGTGGALYMTDEYRIRKLTPRECFRLMGFSDEDFDKARGAGTSNTQLYKEAGNSIVVDVLYHIFKELYKAMPYLFDDLKLSSFFSGIGAFEKGLDRLFADINSQEQNAEINPRERERE